MFVAGKYERKKFEFCDWRWLWAWANGKRSPQLHMQIWCALHCLVFGVASVCALYKLYMLCVCIYPSFIIILLTSKLVYFVCADVLSVANVGYDTAYKKKRKTEDACKDLLNCCFFVSVFMLFFFCCSKSITGVGLVNIIGSDGAALRCWCVLSLSWHCRALIGSMRGWKRGGGGLLVFRVRVRCWSSLSASVRLLLLLKLFPVHREMSKCGSKYGRNGRMASGGFVLWTGAREKRETKTCEKISYENNNNEKTIAFSDLIGGLPNIW